MLDAYGESRKKQEREKKRKEKKTKILTLSFADRVKHHIGLRICRRRLDGTQAPPLG
jgi:hypothetical protein